MTEQVEVVMEHIGDNLTQDTAHHPHLRGCADDHRIFHSLNHHSQ